VLIGTGVAEYSARFVFNTLNPDLRDVLIELISEGIRGARHSENFILMERGYPSYEDFDEKRRRGLTDSCMCFSNLNRVGMLWTDDMGKQFDNRNKTLFSRHKNYHIFANPDGSLFSTACFADTYHEIILTLSFSQCGQIKEISGTFLRSPNKVCCESVKRLSNLIGQNLTEMTKKEIADFVGGTSGCTHALEMCYDLSLSLLITKGRVGNIA
jgi:hypothetical protein